MKDYDKERMIAADGNRILYEIIDILDRYDFGHVGHDQPGEYASEARKLVDYFRTNNSLLQKKYLIDLTVSQFNFSIRPIFTKKYSNAVDEINAIYLNNKHDPLFS